MKVGISLGLPLGGILEHWTVLVGYIFCFFSLPANVEALKEMLGDSEGDVHVPVPR